jgi:hypothetical protein
LKWACPRLWVVDGERFRDVGEDSPATALG